MERLAYNLKKLQPRIEFDDARDLLTDVSQKLRRLISPFRQDSELLDTILDEDVARALHGRCGLGR